MLAASILIGKYRTATGKGPFKEEAIDAEESKLILNAIFTGNWQPVPFGQTNAQNLFFQLGIGAQDGLKLPTRRTPDDVRKAAQAWLLEHPEYRVKRFVPKADNR